MRKYVIMRFDKRDSSHKYFGFNYKGDPDFFEDLKDAQWVPLRETHVELHYLMQEDAERGYDCYLYSILEIESGVK